ncbi:MAG: TonB-dependent receptor [Bacteroidia bacterium]|nr:TonB-dependent receptor [Bacteroidia bacterium]NNJ55949.1 TonB-dependent receptor [Bacteroidia bacterium]
MKYKALIAILVLSINANAQSTLDSARVMDSVQIAASYSVNQQLFSDELLKVNPTQNFAELLQKQTGIFIKSTGVGSLNTPSYKGLGTMHIPINIEGANMQSSMNGTMDLSLIDAFHFSGSSFSEQDNQQLGQSNMGSSLNLNAGNIQPRIEANVSGNTQNGQSAGFKFGNKGNKWSYQASVFGTQSENNVALEPYIGEDSLLENTDFQKVSLLQNLSYRSIKFGVWKNTIYIQASERSIPPTLLSSSDSRQSDINAMMINVYQKQLQRRWWIQAQNQIWKEQINFKSITQNLDARSDVLNFNSTVEASKRVNKKLRVSVGAGNENAYYTSTNLESEVQYNRYRAFYNASFRVKKIRFRLNQQVVNFDRSRFGNNASLEATSNLGKKYAFTISAQTVYRIPTLNEMYWYEPGFASGNENLKPEEGKKLDVIVTRKSKSLSISLNPFAGLYDNMIAWQGFPEISPVNIQSVFVRGIELQAIYSHHLWKGRISINNNIHYVKSTYNPSDQKDATFGKQLIYTPEISSNLTITFSRKKFGIYVNEQFVGENFVASDNSNSLDPYFLTELGGYYIFDNIRLGGSVSNLFNTAYFTIPNTPLPGRIIKINANYTLKIKSWKKH